MTKSPKKTLVEKVKYGGKSDWLFDRYERGHVCGIKPTIRNRERRIACDCHVFYSSAPKIWYKSIYNLAKKIDFIASKRLGRFNKVSHFIDHYIIFRY